MGKTIRFGDLVRGSGRPHPVTLWIDPKKDPSFSKAVQENRVLTIHGDPASHRKEFGEIGFKQEHGAMYLIFPEPLPKESDAWVVGINYELTEEPPARDPIPAESLPKPKRKKPELPKREPSKPILKRFAVRTKRVAVLEEVQTIKASDEEGARRAALAALKKKRFDLGRAVVQAEVIGSAELAGNGDES